MPCQYCSVPLRQVRQRKKIVRYLIATMGLGMTFLGIKIVEYQVAALCRVTRCIIELFEICGIF